MSSRSLHRICRLGALLALLLILQPLSSQSPAFYPDDPIAADDDMSLDASKVVPIEDSNGYDFVANTFADLGQMFPGAGMLKNARVTVAVKNLANQRQTVRDQSLTIPQAYQPVRRDPVGRTIMLELRKTF